MAGFGAADLEGRRKMARVWAIERLSGHLLYCK